MNSVVLNGKIDSLQLEDEINSILVSNKILIVRDLCKLRRKDFKNIGIKDKEINQIVIKLQLNGLDINRKM